MSIDVRTGVVPRDHVVQFYARDDDLVASVGQYLIDGFLAGETVVVIATPGHRAAFEAALIQAGIEVRGVRAATTLVTADAAQVLSTVSVNGRPDADTFSTEIGALISPALDSGRRVRVYGDMVTLLWQAGNITAAIELEALWNDLGRSLPFSLFCAYPTATIDGDDVTHSFRHVCHLHSAVVADPINSAPQHAFAVARAADTRSFTCELYSPGIARRFVADTLAAWGLESFVGDASIVVAELATNAVLHARSQFVVAVSSHDHTVRLSIRDASPVLPSLQTPERCAVTGRGLLLVAAVARRWGIELISGGKVVWAELAPH